VYVNDGTKDYEVHRPGESKLRLTHGHILAAVDTAAALAMSIVIVVQTAQKTPLFLAFLPCPAAHEVDRTSTPYRDPASGLGVRLLCFVLRLDLAEDGEHLPVSQTSIP
jgi:hypothetical protein